MTGATENQNGSAGMVPAPQAGDENKVLTGSGLWGELPKHVMYETKADVEQAFVNGELKNGDVWMTKEKNVAPTPTPTPTPDPEPEPEEPDIPDPETSEINDIQTWLKCAEITDKSYTTLAEVIADSGILLTLMSNLDAMTYLARSTGFMEEGCSNATFMQYLGNSQHVDDTVLNSDIWLTKISSSSYWDLIYPSVTVHSSAFSTITVAGKTFTSDATGNTQHSMPWGTFSISDSVSGQSFECTIGRDTTHVYVMPEGALYWYGNLCTDVTGGWVRYNESGSASSGKLIMNTNDFYIETPCNSYGAVGIYTSKIINKSNFTKLKFLIKDAHMSKNNYSSSVYGVRCGLSSSTNITIIDDKGITVDTINAMENFIYTKNISQNGFVAQINDWAGVCSTTSAIWLE